jgi:hypothetical protein
MAGKIGKKFRRGSKNHGQQVGVRDRLRDRRRDIDSIVDSAQTGKKKPKGK